MRLAGKVALITGATGGLGLACVERFAAEGALVAATSRDPARTEEVAAAVRATRGTAGVLGLPLDVRDWDAWERAVVQTVARFGRLDILVNNAAVVTYSNLVDDPLDEMDDVIAVNLRGVLYGCRAAIPAMIDGGGGAIVNISSVSAVSGGFLANQAVYAATKAGVIGLTRNLARTWGGRGVRSNVVGAGGMATGMLQEYLASAAERGAADNPFPIPPPRGTVPAPSGGPAEVAATVAFLASDDAAYVNGALLVVDGGALA